MSDHVEIQAPCPTEGGCGQLVEWLGKARNGWVNGGQTGGGTEWTDIRCVCDDTVSTGFARQVEVNRERRNQEAA